MIPRISQADSRWLCCQLGAREHYAIPRALHSNGLLHELLTDLWIRPGALTYWGNKLAGRFHPSLADARVIAPNAAAFAFELKSQAAGLEGWDLIVNRNEWFQETVLAQLARRARDLDHEPTTIFAYSYAADRIFEFARARGWRTVLGQIDAGAADERLVASLHQNGNRNGWKPAPLEYWRRWRTECQLADRIITNSSWSRDLLLQEGVPAEKIRVISLAFEAGEAAQSFAREYPSAFTPARPLRVLFLGQVKLRKGVGELFQAVRLLENEPVEFWFVGPQQLNVPPDLQDHPRIKWFGAVSRANVERFYRDADVFIFPTLSDGFGLTQLEAQSWKLPVIASRFCGEVVQHDRNGLILEVVSGEAIAKAVRELLRAPECLAAMSEQSDVREKFSLKTLASSLANL